MEPDRHATDTERSVLHNQRGQRQAAIVATCACGWEGPDHTVPDGLAARLTAHFEHAAQMAAQGDGELHLRLRGGGEER